MRVCLRHTCTVGGALIKLEITNCKKCTIDSIVISRISETEDEAMEFTVDRDSRKCSSTTLNSIALERRSHRR